MRRMRSEGEEQGLGPEEEKKKKQTKDVQKERRSGRSRSNGREQE